VLLWPGCIPGAFKEYGDHDAAMRIFRSQYCARLLALEESMWPSRCSGILLGSRYFVSVNVHLKMRQLVARALSRRSRDREAVVNLSRTRYRT
jgi:hypothetical protein